MFYDPSELPSQETFTREEVTQLLSNFGHTAVPDDCLANYKHLRCVPKWEATSLGNDICKGDKTLPSSEKHTATLVVVPM